MKILRNGHLVGQLPAQIMQDSHKNIFEEGCNAIFVRWTALQLAIQNEWGGFQSQQKAEQLYKDVLNWFYTNKDREQSDLEEILDEALQVDFNVLADDDSPYQIARSLCNMYNQVATGDYSYVAQLKATPIPQAASCKEVIAPEDAENDSSSSDDEELDVDDGGQGDGENVDDMMDTDEGAKQVSIIDEDGFQLVQRKGKR